MKSVCLIGILPFLSLPALACTDLIAKHDEGATAAAVVFNCLLGKISDLETRVEENESSSGRNFFRLNQLEDEARPSPFMDVSAPVPADWLAWTGMADTILAFENAGIFATHDAALNAQEWLKKAKGVEASVAQENDAWRVTLPPEDQQKLLEFHGVKFRKFDFKETHLESGANTDWSTMEFVNDDGSMSRLLDEALASAPEIPAPKIQ